MMNRLPGLKRLSLLLGMGLMLLASKPVVAEVYVVASIDLPVNEIGLRELRSIYKGRLSQVNGQKLTPLNIIPGTPDRNEFLTRVMEQSELDYTGYWHVRRYSGQGTPPQEAVNHGQLFEVLKKHPDRIGYLWVPDGNKPKLPEGLKVIKLK